MSAASTPPAMGAKTTPPKYPTHNSSRTPKLDTHQANVVVLSRRMAALYEKKQPYRVYHGATNSTRKYQVERSNMIDTSNLNNILTVDKAAKTCLVEPNVPMDQLVDQLLIYGLMPPVVMEFPGITVGGGYSGTSGESSSFKYGFFDNTINWVEFVLPNGQIVGASRNEREDLFRGAAGAFGTLGVATAFELQLVDAKTYVELTMTPCDSASRTLGAVDDAAEDQHWDYVDGIILAKDRGVLLTGKLTDAVESTTPVHRFTRASDPWFYLHVERSVRNRTSVQPVVHAIPLRDYLFRYDRGTFWTGKYAYEYFSIPFNRVTRWALNRTTKTRNMYHAFHKAGLTDQYMVQDLALPSSKAQQFIEYLDDDFAIYPLWLCPLQAPEHKSMHPHPRAPGGVTELSEEPMMNVGLWGPGPTQYAKFVEANRRLEAKVHELGGMKWLYAQAFYSEEEFWANFDRAWYDGLRSKYKADHLPDVYQKVRTKGLHEEGKDGKSEGGADAAVMGRKLSRKGGVSRVRSVYGAAHMMTHKDYLLTGK